MGHCSGWQSAAHKDHTVPALPARHSTPPAPYCSRTDSSSKQICRNSTCNLALNWEQIEQVLCVVGNKSGVCVQREIYWKRRAKEMIPGSFMWGKVGLLSVGAPRQESYYYRKLEQPSPALHLDKIQKKRRQEKRNKCFGVCLHDYIPLCATRRHLSAPCYLSVDRVWEGFFYFMGQIRKIVVTCIE